MPSREVIATQDRDAATRPDEAPSPAAAERGALLVRRPSAIGLARLAERRARPAGGASLYRRLVRLLEIGPEAEFVLVPSGRGIGTQLLAELAGVSGAGVDPDPELVEAAIARTREARLADRLHFEVAPPEDLPYQDSVFDVAVGDIGLAAAADPAAAVRELARVTRPGGTVVLVQLSWTGNVPPERREALVASLGVRPLLLVEWKQLLRDAGVVDLYVEDWSDSECSLRQPGVLGGLIEFASARSQVAALFRAWRRWGWRGVRHALRARGEVRALVTRERVLGLSLIKGTKWPSAPAR